MREIFAVAALIGMVFSGTAQGDQTHIKVKRTLSVSLSYTYSMPGASGCGTSAPTQVDAQLFVTPPGGVEAPIVTILEQDVLPSQNCYAKATRTANVTLGSEPGIYQLRLSSRNCNINNYFAMKFFPSVAIVADGHTDFSQDYSQNASTVCNSQNVSDVWQIHFVK